ncbi:MAG: tetratricopeptide repeat protein [Streptosporangiales bacterium]|nr:tetratricopeptide repeat protein [Streptosporangiales bacterium]
MSATPDETTADETAAVVCEQARSYAERGDLEAAADAFQRVLELGATGFRAQAALGLAAVREDAGDVQGAREADRVAMASGDPEYAPRAAYHLAISYEREGLRDEARSAWQAMADSGNEAYRPAGLVALAYLADEDGDFDAARARWQEVIDGGDPQYAPAAAVGLATRLTERGEPGAARKVLAAALDRHPDGPATGQLRTSVGIAHLEEAIAAFREAARGSDADTLPLVLELLARTLPLRGREEEAAETWQTGLHHDDPQVAAAVRARLRREFGTGTEAGIAEDSPEYWWEEFVETAVCAGTLPLLANEVFSALDLMYALVAAHRAETGDDLPEELEGLYEALDEAVLVPTDFAWGSKLQASVRERLRHAPPPQG